MSECNKPYTVSYFGELDIDDLATIPDYFLGAREAPDEATGGSIYTPVRIPGARVMPTANLANVVAIATNNPDLVVPENQIVAGRIDNNPSGNIVKVADDTHPAQFLMLKNYTNGKVLIQSTGFITYPNMHNYIVNVQYYLGANGEPVTDSTVTGQKLFIALDSYTLMVNGAF